ncbi:hypothetical protein BBAD15_g6426 [Beauveria bassiana D1-5]|uniref:Uncharacterized protein n=1 Tax=Beauveria bassiana D1-5 TaxID=1245745 RepID=A0A0A2VQ20_BEABA|nr:hypothetical protein BBAD15_g6426 [Beauveria bassiana D1-5]
MSGITDEAALEAHDLVDAEDRMQQALIYGFQERDKRESISSQQSTGSNDSAPDPNKSKMGSMGSMGSMGNKGNTGNQKPSLLDRGKEALGLNSQ